MQYNYEAPKGKLAYAWWRTKRFYVECVRVLRVTKKPDMQEFKTITQVTGLGMLIIGAIGFLTFLIKELIVYVF